MFETYRFPPDYFTFWHLGARMGIGPVTRFLRRVGCRSLLDVGSGGGSNSLLAAQAGFAVTSCDLSAASLKQMRRTARALGPGVCPSPVVADSCRLPLLAESYDVVIASHLIEHLDEPRRLLREVHRVLRPGGTLRLSCPSTFHLMRISRWFGLHLDPADHKVIGYNPAGVAAMLPEGFRVVRCTYQGRFFESNFADVQHLVARAIGLKANPVERDGRPARQSPGGTLVRLVWIAKEAVVLPMLAVAKLEDALLFFVPGSMISLEIEKR